MQIDLAAIIVADYDPAIRFFVDALGFDLVEDSTSETNDGRPKRWGPSPAWSTTPRPSSWTWPTP